MEARGTDPHILFNLTPPSSQIVEPCTQSRGHHQYPICLLPDLDVDALHRHVVWRTVANAGPVAILKSGVFPQYLDHLPAIHTWWCPREGLLHYNIRCPDSHIEPSTNTQDLALHDVLVCRRRGGRPPATASSFPDETVSGSSRLVPQDDLRAHQDLLKRWTWLKSPQIA